MSEVFASTQNLRRRARAARPSPAVPLLLLAGVVAGGIVVTLLSPESMQYDTPVRLAYWCLATIVALAATGLIARRQGSRTGLWVSRRWLIIGGLAALAVLAAAVLYAPFLPGDLLLRGNLPLLALTVGIAAWAYSERSLGLSILTAVLIPLTLLANLYNMENVLFRLGIPYFDAAGDVTNLAVVTLALLIAAAAFALARRHATKAVTSR